MTHVVATGGSELHYDERTVRKEGAYTAVTTVTNFEKPSRVKLGGVYYSKMSLRSAVLLDCATKRFRVEDSVWHDQRFGGGAGHRSSQFHSQWFGPEWKHYATNLNTRLFPVVCQ